MRSNELASLRSLVLRIRQYYAGLVWRLAAWYSEWSVSLNWRSFPVLRSAYSWRVTTYVTLHVINWPYLDIVSTLTVGGHFLSLVRRCLTLCLMIYEILQSAHRPSDSRWRLIFSLPISTFSALGLSHVMRSINVRYLLTYLLKPSAIGEWR